MLQDGEDGDVEKNVLQVKETLFGAQAMEMLPKLENRVLQIDGNWNI